MLLQTRALETNLFQVNNDCIITTAQFPLYVYPFLGSTSRTKPFEFLRLTSLGVIGALVKNEAAKVISFLLETEIIPLCLRIMELGHDLSKTVAIFVIQKILLDNYGLSYICQSEQRLITVLDHLDGIISSNEAGKGARAMKHAIRCYLRLTEEENGLIMLRKRIPNEILNDSIVDRVGDDTFSVKFIYEIRSRILP